MENKNASLTTIFAKAFMVGVPLGMVVGLLLLGGLKFLGVV